MDYYGRLRTAEKAKASRNIDLPYDTSSKKATEHGSDLNGSLLQSKLATKSAMSASEAAVCGLDRSECMTS